MVRLAEKPPDRLAAWLSQMWVSYRNSLIEAGFTSDEADANVQRNTTALFVDGAPNSDQRIFDVFEGDVVVGTLWLAPRRDGGSPDEWYIYDVAIEEEFRGRGLGRATMLAAESYVATNGGRRLALNVFGYNTVARALYDSLDYEVVAIAMRKEFG